MIALFPWLIMSLAVQLDSEFAQRPEIKARRSGHYFRNRNPRFAVITRVDVESEKEASEIRQKIESITGEKVRTVRTKKRIHYGSIGEADPRTVAMARSVIGLPVAQAKRLVEKTGFVWFDGGVRIHLFIPNAINARVEDGIVVDAKGEGEDTDMRSMEEQIADLR